MSYKGLADEKLMKLYKAGDAEAFKELYERHAQKVYSYIAKKINNKELVEDMYQEVYAKLHHSKSHYRENLPVLPWIFTITKNTMIDVLRKNKKLENNLQFEIYENELEYSENNELIQNENLTKNFLKQIPSEQAQILRFRYLDEKSFMEIAEILKTSEENVRQKLSRIIRKLKSRKIKYE